jgi:predicted nucleic acid-binding protein
LFKNVFLDANIIADLYDSTRISHKDSIQVVQFLAKDPEIDLFTSCDILTTLYYILAKKDKTKALDAILQINELCTVVEFSNDEVLQSCTLMKEDKSYNDLEDTIQFIMAKKIKADLILSNDKGFISKDIKLLSSSSFYLEYVK